MDFLMDKINSQKSRETDFVVVLPYTKDKILMQLRDDKESISFPGQWGFFGGAVNDKETSLEAAKRELFEEIGFKPKSMHKFYSAEIPEIGNLISDAHCCQLTVPVQDIKLSEGTDLGLFSVEQIRTGKLYSAKMKKEFPVIGISYLMDAVGAFLDYAKKKNIKIEAV